MEVGLGVQRPLLVEHFALFGFGDKVTRVVEDLARFNEGMCRQLARHEQEDVVSVGQNVCVATESLLDFL